MRNSIPFLSDSWHSWPWLNPQRRQPSTRPSPFSWWHSRSSKFYKGRLILKHYKTVDVSTCLQGQKKNHPTQWSELTIFSTGWQLRPPQHGLFLQRDPSTSHLSTATTVRPGAAKASPVRAVSITTRNFILEINKWPFARLCVVLEVINGTSVRVVAIRSGEIQLYIVYSFFHHTCIFFRDWDRT